MRFITLGNSLMTLFMFIPFFIPPSPYQPSRLFVRNDTCRVTRYGHSSLHVFHYYCPGTYRNSITYLYVLYNANRRPYINIIPYMGGMKCHTPDRGELVKIYIVAYHRRSVDDHRATMHNAEAITNLGIPLYAYLMSNIDPT